MADVETQNKSTYRSTKFEDILPLNLFVFSLS